MPRMSDEVASVATNTYLPPLPVPHEREGVGRKLADTVAERAVALGFVPDGIEVVRELEKQQWMLRVQLRERA